MVTNPRDDHSVISIDLVTIYNVEVMFYFNCWISQFYSTILVLVFPYSEKTMSYFYSVFNLFLNIACIMNGVTKKPQRLTKQNPLKVFYYNKIIEIKTLLSVKNNKTKQTKQLHITWNNFFEIHNFSKGEVILHYFSYNERCL